MGKRGIFSHIESSAISNLQALKNELFLKEGSIHTLKLTEEDGIVIPEKEKEQGFHTKHVVIIGHNENEYYGCVLIQSTPNRNIHSLETIKKDFQVYMQKIVGD
ncbi:MAG TPA: hypothetical protein DEQ30_03135 [Porphyromonadaceae bacterium]|nr:hypothetical protein [Porphyromonadaceae bacterium]